MEATKTHFHDPPKAHFDAWFPFYARVGIQQVFLKACRRWASMCHRMMTVAQIDEPSNPLDFGLYDSDNGGPLL